MNPLRALFSDTTAAVDVRLQSVADIRTSAVFQINSDPPSDAQVTAVNCIHHPRWPIIEWQTATSDGHNPNMEIHIAPEPRLLMAVKPPISCQKLAIDTTTLDRIKAEKSGTLILNQGNFDYIFGFKGTYYSNYHGNPGNKVDLSLAPIPGVAIEYSYFEADDMVLSIKHKKGYAALATFFCRLSATDLDIHAVTLTA